MMRPEQPEQIEPLPCITGCIHNIVKSYCYYLSSTIFSIFIPQGLLLLPENKTPADHVTFFSLLSNRASQDHFNSQASLRLKLDIAVQYANVTQRDNCSFKPSEMANAEGEWERRRKDLTWTRTKVIWLHAFQAWQMFILTLFLMGTVQGSESPC